MFLLIAMKDIFWRLAYIAAEIAAGPPPMMIVSYILIEAADAVPSGAFALEASFLVCYFAVRADSSSYRTPPASAADVETGYFT